MKWLVESLRCKRRSFEKEVIVIEKVKEHKHDVFLADIFYSFEWQSAALVAMFVFSSDSL